MIPRTRLPKIRATMVTALAITAAGLPALASPLGATEGCGTYSFGFEGTRLLNDGISDSAGPFPVDLPGGVYTVTLIAHDHHDTQVGVPTQPGEQFFVVLDSGYASPLSSDVPDDETLTTTVFSSQQIEASTSIRVQHGGTSGINSVDVVCVGFTPEPSADPTVEPPAVVVPPVVDTPATDPPVDPPKQDIGDPVTIVRPPDIVPPAAVVPEVKGTVEFPPITPQLAATGPGEYARTMAGFGALMIVFGAALIRRERRFDSLS